MMGRVVDALQGVLTAAVPPGVPVLLPEDQRTPLEAAPTDAQGRPVVGGGARGLAAYLAQHPTGYVQIESPLAITSDGLTGTFWVAVASVAPTAASAAALAAQVRAALCGTPRSPSQIREVTPAEPAVLSPGAWIVRPTLEVLTLDGVPAV